MKLRSIRRWLARGALVLSCCCAWPSQPLASQTARSAASARLSHSRCFEGEAAYSPRPAPSAPWPKLPAPRLELQPIKVDDAYTVWGANYYRNTPHHARDVNKATIELVGYITKTNLPDAPKCAIHRAGRADPERCRAPVPAFWLGGRPDAPESECIKVMGFASNFAQIYEAIVQVDGGKSAEPYVDALWGDEIPNPLPAAGAKVKVRGEYAATFTKASSGAERDVTMGILSYASMYQLQPAAALATLPGLKRKAPRFVDQSDPWLGLTRAEVQIWVNSGTSELGHGRGVYVFGARRKLTVRGAVWLLEWIPGGCSDWYESIELRFQGDRVVATKRDPRARHTGLNCN